MIFMNENPRIDLDCPQCRNRFVVTPRQNTWTTTTRVAIKCPHCLYEARYKGCPKGAVSTAPPVDLMMLNDGRTVTLEEYDGAMEEATRFADIFRNVWNRMPGSAKKILDSHWSLKPGAPDVWFLDNRKDWNGRGWAATKDEGCTLYFLSTVVQILPAEHLQLFIAHECGHALGIVEQEPSHMKAGPSKNHHYRQEWFVWQLMKEWGFDQVAAEAWMYQHFDDVRRRASPLEWELCLKKVRTDHERIEALLSD